MEKSEKVTPLVGGTAIGIDVGGTSVKVAALRPDGLASTGQSGRYARPASHALREAIAGTVRRVLTERDGVAQVRGVGLCVPGLTDDRRACVVQSVNLPALNGVRFTNLLPTDLRGFSPHVVNDAYAAAFDWWTLHRPSGRLLAIALGTGVGGAVLDDGVPLRVDGDSPGHLGQIDVGRIEPTRDAIGPDGGANGLEAYVGVSALVARYSTDAATAAAGLDEGSPPLVALARAIRIAHAIYRPRTVLLLGGIGIRMTPALPALRRRVDDHLTGIARDAWTLTTGDDDFHAARGAARLAINGMIECTA